MSAFMALVRKDVRIYLANRRALLTSLVAPILLGAFIGSVLGRAPTKPAAIPIGLVDLDQSAISKKIVADLSQDATLAVKELPETEAIGLVRKGTMNAAAVIPKGFGQQASDALFRRDIEKPQIEIHYDPSQSMVLGMVKGLLTEYVMQVVSADVFGGSSQSIGRQRDRVTNTKELEPQTRDALLNLFKSIQDVQGRYPENQNDSGPAQQGLTMPFGTRAHEVASGEQDYNAYAHAFAGMTVQFILFMGVELGIGLLLMRRMGLWQRLRAAPLSRMTLLGSRITAGTIIALVLMAGIFVAAIVIFKVRIEGSIVGFLAVAVSFAALTSSLGLLIAALGRTAEATRGMAIVLTLLLVMLGGAWIPTFVFPAWLQSLTQFVPTRWAIDGFDAMTWRAQPLQTILVPVSELLGLSAALSVLAVITFKWEE
jgi:ABC-2 type transport system permease protein